jgi:hypothetical protein
MGLAWIQNLWAARSGVVVDSDYPTGAAWFGYIPRASRADALAYAAAWAEKYIEAPAAVGAYLHRYLDGYLFELQERGIGKRAWLPSILQVWDTQRERGEPEQVYLALDRTIEGTRTGDRIGFIVLPEGSPKSPTTPGLVANGPILKSLRPERDALASSVQIFMTASVLVLIGSLSLRLAFPPKSADHPIIAPAGPVSMIRLPIGQWPSLMAIARRGGYVTKMQYQGSTWQILQGAAWQNTPDTAKVQSAKPPVKKPSAGNPGKTPVLSKNPTKGGR